MNHDQNWAVRAMLQYFYRLDYDSDYSSNLPLLSFHAVIYTIADKYNVSGLKSLAARKFGTIVEQQWTDDEEFMLDFFDAIHYIYNNTLESDHLLRDIAVATVQKHVDKLLNPDTASRSVFLEGKSLLSECPDFAVDLTLANAAANQAAKAKVVRKTMLDEYLNWTARSSAPSPPRANALYDSDDEQAFV